MIVGIVTEVSIFYVSEVEALSLEHPGTPGPFGSCMPDSGGCGPSP